MTGEIHDFQPVKTPPASVIQTREPAVPPGSEKPHAVNWVFPVLAIWLSGMLFSLMRLVVGFIKMRRTARAGAKITDSRVKEILVTISGDIRIGDRIRLVSTPEFPMPATFGAIRPFLLLPEKFSRWPKDKLQAILGHEFAHIKRRDHIYNLAAQITCAVYWFNPLVWIALHHFWQERETACDDFVLRKGLRGHDYADHLLEIACAFSRFKSLRRCNSVMVPKPNLKMRLRHILAGNVCRKALSRRTLVISTAAVLFILIPLAAASIQAKLNQTESFVDLVENLRKGDSSTRTGAAWALGDREDEGAVPALIKALNDKDPEVRGMVVWALGEIKDRRALSPLMRALDERNDYVREMIVKAIGEFEDKGTVSPLTEVMRDKNPDVRTAVIWAMGEIEGREAFDVILDAIKDPSPIVRGMAAAVLADFGDKRSLKALEYAVKDRDASVREKAAISLGALKSLSSVDTLVKALSDKDARIRCSAAWALGEIGDARAVKPLIKMLQDNNPEVRGIAVWSLDEISID